MVIILFVVFFISIYGAYKEYRNWRPEKPLDLFESNYEYEDSGIDEFSYTGRLLFGERKE